jgi:hypothetical protein
MFARHASMHLKPNTRAEFYQTLEKEIIPLLRRQNGFQDEIAFVAAGGREVVGGTPEIRNFEVTHSTFHKIAARVAA